MCDPVSLTIAATAVATVGTAVGGYMQHQQARYEKKVATANQRLENERAARALDAGEIEQRNLSRKHAALAGAARASMAANGVDLGFGTPADFQGDLATYAAEDREALSRNTMNEVRGIEISAANYGAGAKAAGMRAKSAAISAGFDISSTILGGIGNVNKIRASRSGYAG